MQKGTCIYKTGYCYRCNTSICQSSTRSAKMYVIKRMYSHKSVKRGNGSPKQRHDDGASLDDRLVYTDTMQETVSILNSKAYLKKNILLTTGSKNIPEYVNIKDYKKRS